MENHIVDQIKKSYSLVAAAKVVMAETGLPKDKSMGIALDIRAGINR